MAASDLHLPSDNHSDEVNTIVEQMCLIAHPDPLRLPKVFNLNKAPDNYRKATVQPDADVWRVLGQPLNYLLKA